jgi:hypothetical protein
MPMEAKDYVTLSFSAIALIVAGSAATFSIKQYNLNVVRDAREQKQAMEDRKPIISIKHYQPTAGMDGDRVTAWFFTPVIENDGATPAIRLISQTNAAGQPVEFPGNYAFPDFSINKSRIPTVLGPKQTLNLSDVRLTSDYLALVSAKTANVIIYGWTEYDDVFEVRHRTEFSVRMHIDGDVHRGDARFSFPNFGAYNCIDKGCKYTKFEDIPIDKEILPAGAVVP